MKIYLLQDVLHHSRVVQIQRGVLSLKPHFHHFHLWNFETNKLYQSHHFWLDSNQC